MVPALIDAGPLIALIDSGDPAHQVCESILEKVQFPLITTWPAFTEAMYFMHRLGGWRMQESLWAFVEREVVAILASTEDMAQRMRDLMKQYRDAPMDLADASLVVAAETLQLQTIITLDSHFRAYRLSDGTPFEVLPSP